MLLNIVIEHHTTWRVIATTKSGDFQSRMNPHHHLCNVPCKFHSALPKKKNYNSNLQFFLLLFLKPCFSFLKELAFSYNLDYCYHLQGSCF